MRRTFIIEPIAPQTSPPPAKWRPECDRPVVGAGGLLLDQRADGDVWPVDAVEVEDHQLRVLPLVLVRLAPVAGDRLDPERRLGLRGLGVAPGGLPLEARNAVLAVPPPALMVL